MVQKLPVEQLEELGEALLDFTSVLTTVIVDCFYLILPTLYTLFMMFS
ncbi:MULTISPECIES: DUF4351 domain-containing protein [unclassified Dolichospermum]|nr:DUF4351 domain-containing protein [Dolichospermum sp. BR01]